MAVDRGGLDGTEARGRGNLPMRREGRVKLDVLDENALPSPHRLSARRARTGIDSLEVLEEVLAEAALGDDLQHFKLGIVKLDIAEIGVTGLDGAYQYFVESRFEVFSRHQNSSLVTRLLLNPRSNLLRLCIRLPSRNCAGFHWSI